MRGATLIILLFVMACTPTVTSPVPRAVLVTGPPPPRAIDEVQPPPPSPQSAWVVGYWMWTGVSYAWIPGHWETPPPNARWMESAKALH